MYCVCDLISDMNVYCDYRSDFIKKVSNGNLFYLPVFLQSAKPSCVKTPNLPCAVGGLGSPARSKISPNPPLPAPLSLLEPRWPPVVPLASPCHSCCLSPLCCYHCCSPAPTPYVSIKTRTSHASTDLSFSMQLPFEIHLSYLIHNDDMISDCSYLGKG